MAKKLASRVLSAIRDKMQGRVKLIHMLLETAISLLSCFVFFPMSTTTQRFDQNCLLNSNIYIKIHSNNSVSLDLTKTVFGDIDNCNFTTFFHVVAFLHGIIWIWFFFHLDKLATKEGSSVNLLFPALVTHFILFICAIVCSVMIGDGFTSWCDRIVDNNNGLMFSLSCKEYESLSWTENRAKFYTYTQMALISSWIMVAFLLIFIVMTCVHLYWDFLDTFYQKSNKQSPLETSGFVDNGVGILNKLSESYNSTDGFYIDSLEIDSNQAGGAVGGAAGDGSGGVGGAHSNTNKSDSDPHMEMIVNATVHTPVDSPTPDGEAEAAVVLRSRGNAVSKH